MGCWYTSSEQYLLIYTPTTPSDPNRVEGGSEEQMGQNVRCGWFWDYLSVLLDVPQLLDSCMHHTGSEIPGFEQ